MTNILIDGHMLGENEGGIERYTKNILLSLAKNTHIGVILYRKPKFPISKNVKTHYVLQNDFFRLFIIPFILMFQKYDIYLSSYTTPLFKPWGKKYIVTLHDISYIPQRKYFSIKDQLLFKTILPISLVLADIIIVPSNFIKEEVKKWYPQHAHKTQVVYEGVDPVLLSCKTNSKTNNSSKHPNIIRGRYFLCINSKNKRKNINLIIQAFCLLPNKNLKLVIVGGNKNIQTKGIDDRIKILPYVDDYDLAYLYNKAHALIYYSSYEGFGLPIIESIANHTPVIASDIPCLREIGKKYITYVSPNDPSRLFQVLQKIASKSKKKVSYNPSHFPYSWKKTARKIIRIAKTAFRSTPPKRS